MKHVNHVAIALALVALAAEARADGEPARPKPTEERTPFDRARWSGTFKFAGSTNEEAARRAAIDKGIETLFFAIKGIARSRLTSGTKIDPWVAFTLDGTRIRVRTPSGTEAVSREDGVATDYVSDGERTKLSQWIHEGKVMQAFVADEGRRLNEWTLSPDGTTLSVKVTVSSAKLSHPVVYTLTYRRAP